MAVGTFNQPDFTSQGGTLYKTSIDNSVMAISRLATSFAAHEQTVPNMTIRVDAGFVWDGETLTNVAAQNTGTITAPTTNPRIDRVVINNTTGAVSVITGVENASPVEPNIGLGFSPVCKVLLSTSTTAITNNMITDERTFDRGGGRSGEMTNIASASTVDMGTVESHFANITGTTTITSFGTNASTNDPLYLVRFDGVLTLTHSASFILPKAENITTAAGDYSLWQYLGFAFGWRLISYAAASGTPYSQLQNVSATNRILGRRSSGAGIIEENTLSQVLDMVGSAAQGDILYRGSSAWTRLAKGTAGQALLMNSAATAPEWGAAGAFSKYFSSSEQTITASAGYTLAHSMGLEPKGIQLWLICKTAEGNYAVNDTVCYPGTSMGNADGLRGYATWGDATNVYLRLTSGNIFCLFNKTTGASFNPTLANWRIIMRAWA